MFPKYALLVFVLGMSTFLRQHEFHSIDLLWWQAAIVEYEILPCMTQKQGLLQKRIKHGRCIKKHTEMIREVKGARSKTRRDGKNLQRKIKGA